MTCRWSAAAAVLLATSTNGVLLPYQASSSLIQRPAPASLAEKQENIESSADEALFGPTYIIPLRRPKRPTAVSLTESDQGDTFNYASVSSAQLKALRTARAQATREKASLGEAMEVGDNVGAPAKAVDAKRKARDDVNDPSDDIAKTVLTSLAATEYVGAIGIGTVHSPKGCDSLAAIDVPSGTTCKTKEQQTLKVVFDTGSTNLWMASTLCTEGPCVSEGRQRYDMMSSETYNTPEHPRNLTINFATATLIGPVGVDQFHIGPFTVKNQSFGLIEEERGNTFAELPLEGIVGLAFPSMSAGGVKTFFDSVIEQKLLKRNLFAFYLSPTDGQPGASFVEHDARYEEYQPGMDAILWGGVDKQLYEGDLTWFPVTQAHYWATDLYAFYIGDQKMSFGNRDEDDSLVQDSETAPAKLIVDSGTAYYTAEDSLYHDFMSHMACDDKKGPDLTYRLKDVDGNTHDLVLKHEDYMVARCEPGFVKIPVPKKYGPAMLLGELFMRKFFTVFDRGTGGDTDGRIGIARSKPGADLNTKLSED